MHYSKVKREKFGLCNLCKKTADLAWDHVPPKGGIKLSSVEMRTILQTLSGDPSKDKFRISQNGVKYRTLCQKCNNWLGHEFDPTLNKFSNDVSLLVRSPMHLPPVLDVETKPHRLMRGILGHLVAAKADLDSVVFDEQVRNFIFDPTASIPEGI
ncbi:MAG: HNH endonuclease, partial [Nitrospira sp.]|nr:HNH endonuclease [Nitrospira sp.]